MRRVLIGLALVVVGSAPAAAQWVVHDRAVTARSRVTAVVMESLVTTLRQQNERLRRMAARLSAATSLDKYAVASPPPWRGAGSGVPVYAGAYMAALSAGDPLGNAYMDVVQPVLPLPASGTAAAARQALAARLATIDVADAANVAATDTVGWIRATGDDRELRAIAALEGTVTDPSATQSATAVLEKIAGAALIGARQRQARMRLLTGLVEQLLVESKRARETETSGINMQLITLRDAPAIDRAFGAGTGDALRSWRQP